MGELTTSARGANLSPLFVAAYRFGCADAQLVTKIHPPADPVRLAIDSPQVTIKTRSTSTVRVTGLWHECPGSQLKVSVRSEEHTSELQSLMRISYAVFCLKQQKNIIKIHRHQQR